MFLYETLRRQLKARIERKLRCEWFVDAVMVSVGLIYPFDTELYWTLRLLRRSDNDKMVVSRQPDIHVVIGIGYSSNCARCFNASNKRCSKGRRDGYKSTVSMLAASLVLQRVKPAFCVGCPAAVVAWRSLAYADESSTEAFSYLVLSALGLRKRTSNRRGGGIFICKPDTTTAQYGTCSPR